MLGFSGGTNVFLHGPGLLIVGLESLQRSDFYDVDHNDKDEMEKEVEVEYPRGRGWPGWRRVGGC